MTKKIVIREAVQEAVKTANPPNLDIKLSEHRDAVNDIIKWLASVGLYPTSGKDAAFPPWDKMHWEDTNTYTVVETSWTEKTRCWLRSRSIRHAAYVLCIAVKGYIDTAGETLYVRIRSLYRGTLAEFSITETSSTTKVDNVFYAKVFHWDDPLMVEAYVTGGTGYIEYVKIDFIVLDGLIFGRYYESPNDKLHAVKPIAVTDDGKVKVAGDVIESHAEGLDETVAQELTLDMKWRKLLSIYVKASTATNIHLDVSFDGITWLEDFKVWSSVSEVKETLEVAFRYVKLRSDGAGTSGDTISLYMSAK